MKNHIIISNVKGSVFNVDEILKGIGYGTTVMKYQKYLEDCIQQHEDENSNKSLLNIIKNSDLEYYILFVDEIPILHQIKGVFDILDYNYNCCRIINTYCNDPGYIM